MQVIQRINFFFFSCNILTSGLFGFRVFFVLCLCNISNLFGKTATIFSFWSRFRACIMPSLSRFLCIKNKTLANSEIINRELRLFFSAISSRSFVGLIKLSFFFFFKCIYGFFFSL